MHRASSGFSPSKAEAAPRLRGLPICSKAPKLMATYVPLNIAAVRPVEVERQVDVSAFPRVQVGAASPRPADPVARPPAELETYRFDSTDLTRVEGEYARNRRLARRLHASLRRFRTESHRALLLDRGGHPRYYKREGSSEGQDAELDRTWRRGTAGPRSKTNPVAVPRSILIEAQRDILMAPGVEPYPVPVTLIIFNRPHTTERVFSVIRSVRPKTLLVVADGPRPGNPTDADNCSRARAIATAVDWPCDFRTEFSETNLGCGKRPASGIDWVFHQVDRAIILEDDCLPHPSFFPFVRELLDRFADDERVMAVCGATKRICSSSATSYYFSRYPRPTGWATWRRAWRHYDYQMALWPQAKREGWLESCGVGPGALKRLSHRFDSTHAGRRTNWDYQWLFTCLHRSGLAVIPNKNLVEHIGYGPDATHGTRPEPHPILRETMDFPLVHPKSVIPDLACDSAYGRTLRRTPRRISRYLRFLGLGSSEPL